MDSSSCRDAWSIGLRSAVTLRGQPPVSCYSPDITCGLCLGSASRFETAEATPTAKRFSSIFRYAAGHGWCVPGVAAAIMPERMYRGETIPAALAWEDVQRLLGTTEGEHPADKRDRAIVLLFAVYGLRAGEASGLRLEDIDWEHETLQVRRPKPGRTHRYPLSRNVGDALVRYLREVRPPCCERALFLTLRAPFHPLATGGVQAIVNRRLRRRLVAVAPRDERPRTAAAGCRLVRGGVRDGGAVPPHRRGGGGVHGSISAVRGPPPARRVRPRRGAVPGVRIRAERGSEWHRAFEDRVRRPVAEFLVGESAWPVVQPGTGPGVVLARAGARPGQRAARVARPALPSPDPVVPLQLGTVLLILVAGKWFDCWGGVTWGYRSIIGSRYRMLTRLGKIQFSEAILQSVSHRSHRRRGYSSGQ